LLAAFGRDAEMRPDGDGDGAREACGDAATINGPLGVCTGQSDAIAIVGHSG
jgi:hypothetical protein